MFTDNYNIVGAQRIFECRGWLNNFLSFFFRLHFGNILLLTCYSIDALQSMLNSSVEGGDYRGGRIREFHCSLGVLITKLSSHIGDLVTFYLAFYQCNICKMMI